jgi:general secretion pathway protein C
VLRLAVIALLVYAGVTFWYGRVEEQLQGQQPAEKKEAVAPPAQEEGKPASVEADYRIILTRNIFQAGQEAGAGGQSQANVDDLAETKLHLALLGTVTGGKDDARAIIRDEKTKLEDLYQAGSEVQGAVIGRISRGKVVLLVNGREEVLTIKDPESSDQGRSAAPRAEGRPTERALGAQEAPAREIGNKVPEAQPRRRISFRNAGPQPPVAEEPARSAPAEGQPPEPAGVPDDEAPVPDEGREKAAEQQEQ